MDLRAALLATATAGVLFLIAACGGGASDSTPSQSDNRGGSGTVAQSQPVSGGNGGGSTAKYVTIDLNCSACTSAGGSSIGDGEQVGSGYITGTRHMLLWRGSASSVVDLGSLEAGAVLATSGGVQVGWAGNDDNGPHALKWAGSAGSVVDIHPGGVFEESMAFGIAGDQIIGYGLTASTIHALLWTSRGLVDLNPGGFLASSGTATDGGQQVGFGAPTGSIGIGLTIYGSVAIYGNHALLWGGTAESVVDLHPVSGYDTTSANGVGGGQQVGWGGAYGSEHALLWTGTAESVVDLHPSGFSRTIAQAVAAGQQVGWGTTADGVTHALLWNGTAGSAVDLHIFLPAGFTGSSASGIDASGSIIGSATDAKGVVHAILWAPQQSATP